MPRTSGTRPKGSGIPAQGEGKGPAKGAGAGGPRKPFTPDQPTQVRHDVSTENHDPAEQAYRHEQMRLNRARREAAWDSFDAILANKSHPAYFHAAREVLNRLDGMPIAKQQVEVKHPIEEMTEGELASAIELIRAALEGRPDSAGS